MKSTMKRILNLTLITVAAFGLVTISACREKGPAEKAGESIDHGIEKTKDAVKDATN